MNLRKTIKTILREEVNEMYSRPSEKMDLIITRWLDNLFSGAKMYYNKSYESTHSFDWCNKGMEIASVILYFHNDDSVYDDKRPMSERNFEEGTLMIPESIVNELRNYVPIRRNYLRYKIEEWFDDNIMTEVTKTMGRDDIHIIKFSEYPKTAEVCVPPVEKPEGVTEEEMIELILKTTLHKRDALLRYEEEKPGYIEKLYLDKLHSAEIDRLRGNND
jgi:hypothetical protein